MKSSSIGRMAAQAARQAEVPDLSGLFAQAGHMLNKPVRKSSMPACDFVPPKNIGINREEVLAGRKQYHAPYVTFYKEPLVITDGHMQWLFDESGKRYLDLFAGIVTVSVGHCHPKVNEAIIEQTKRLVHTTSIYAHPSTAEFAKMLVDTLPERPDGQPWKVFFTNSGTESNDLAMSLAYVHSGNSEFYGVRNGYHGMSINLQNVTAVPGWGNKTPGSHMHHVPCPHVYRHPAGDNCVEACIQELDEKLHFESCGKVAGWISESVLGVGGTVPLPPGFLPAVHERIKARGGVTICDEVQTAFGRTGTKYWGFENHGLMPDLITTAKGIGNGLPLGAVIGRADIMDLIGKRTYFNTYSGQPIQMAGGMATLKAIEEEKMQENCLKLGAHLTKRLNTLKETHPIIGDVRGPGLMMGVEFVKDPTTKEPAVEEAIKIWNDLKDMGILVGGLGAHKNTLRIKPPMCITEADCDFFVDSLDECLKNL